MSMNSISTITEYCVQWKVAHLIDSPSLTCLQPSSSYNFGTSISDATLSPTMTNKNKQPATKTMFEFIVDVISRATRSTLSVSATDVSIYCNRRERPQYDCISFCVFKASFFS